MDTKLIVEGLALLAAGEQIMIRGPVAVDLSDVHEWATEVTSTAATPARPHTSWLA